MQLSLYNIKPVSDFIKVSGTYRIDEILSTFNNLVEKFGYPHETDLDKTYNEWAFETPTGIVTIYDYKMNGAQCPEYLWHIGGHDKHIGIDILKAIINS